MPILSSLLSSLIGVDPHSKPVDDPAASQQPQAQSPPPPPPPTHLPVTSTRPQPRTLPPITSERSRRQLGLFFGGATFVLWSVLLTRRRVRTHQLRGQLPYFYYNHHFSPLGGPSIATTPRGAALLAEEEAGRRDPFVAFEALQLATLNVMSAAIMVAGGVAWALDISTIDDLRARARRSIDEAADMGLDPEAEKQVAEWMAKTLGLDVDAEKQKEEAEAKEERGEGEAGKKT